MGAPSVFDVAIVGGGPAGSAAAIAAAETGARVLVLGGPRTARASPGETVHPGIETLLDRLGVLEEFKRCAFPRYRGIRLRTSTTETFQELGPGWLGYQLRRDRFDALLLRRARSLGCTVARGVAALDPLHDEGCVGGVVTTGGAFKAACVIDAGGRRHWLARRLGLAREKHSGPLCAHYGYARGEASEPTDAPLLRVGGDGWTWITSVERRMWAWVRVAPGRKTPACLPRELASLESLGPPHAADVTWRVVRPAAGPGFLLCGDAAAHLDPSSGQGILWALASGIRAGDAAASNDNVSLAAYDDWVARSFEQRSEGLRRAYAVMGLPAP